MFLPGSLRDIPIQRKLSLISMLTCGLALLVAGLAFVAYEQAAFRNAMVDRLSTTLSVISDNSAAALTFNDSASATQTLHSLSADPHIVGAAVYDASGKLFASYRPTPHSDPLAAPSAGAEGYRFDGQYLNLFRAITVAGERAGTVSIRSDLSEMRVRLRRYALIMVVVMLGASAAAMWLAAKLNKAIAGPVSQLAKVVGVVTAEGNYSVRAVKRADDELGRLIDGFNAMLTRIQTQDSALHEARAGLEHRVEERTQELKTEVEKHKRAQEELERVHRQLLQASRQAGMAEVATNVLHNVGNVLNSVNVSAILAADLAQKSKANNLSRVVELLREHAGDLGAFITTDPRGRHVLTHLGNLAEHLGTEQATLVRELGSVRTNIEHIKDIVAMQQSYAKVAGVKEIVSAVDLVEDGLRMNAGALSRHHVEVVREFEGAPKVNIDKHKVLQILVNLVRNAKYACEESTAERRQVTLKISSCDERVRIAVVDNGVGIVPENLTRIFNHGFTTRATGHGFGLHSGALAARELGGTLKVTSEGAGRGATFTLDLPLYSEELAHV